RIGDSARNARLDAIAHLVEAFGRASRIIVDKGLVALVNVRCKQLGRFRIGTGDDQGRNTHDVGSKACGAEIAQMCGSWNQDLSAEMTAFLFGSELILEVNSGGACFNI